MYFRKVLKLIISKTISMKLLPIYFFFAISMVFCFTSCKDACENITCPTGRTCINGTCECPRGFSGENCLKEDLCIKEKVNCENDGICINGECNCLNGYSGTNCEIATANIVWEWHYDRAFIDQAYDMTKTKDEGYIVVGNTNSNNGDLISSFRNTDIWILKLNKNGNIVWEKNYGGPNAESAYCVQQTIDGGYIVAGYADSSDGDGSQNARGLDVWVLKLSNIGNLQWEKTYGGTEADVASHIEQTKDGGFIVSASSTSNNGDVEKNNGGSDYWILELDRSGDKIWSKNYGGESFDRTACIKQTFDNGYIVAGYSLSENGDISGNIGSYDYWIVKLNNTGDLVWEKNYGGTSLDFPTSVIQVEDGGYIVAGYTISDDVDVKENNGDYDYWIVKLDRNGNLEWSKNYGGSENDFANSIQQTDNGEYIIAGSTLSLDIDVQGNSIDNFLVIKIDKFGTIKWETTFGTTGSDIAHSINQTNDGDYVVAGWTEFDEENSDFYIVKLQSN